MKRTVEIIVKPTAEELAEAFCNMGSDEQARFFNRIHDITETWKAPFCFQLQAVTDDDELDYGVRSIMSLIGDYSSKDIT